jgi:repressor LexA
MGKAPSTVQAWEQGKRMPGLDDLFALAGVLGARMEELLDLAAAPVRELEERLAQAEERIRRAASGAAKKEAAFLRSYLEGRKKERREAAGPRLVPLYDLRSVPLLGLIRAGQPRLAAEEALGFTPVPADLDVDYALVVEGDSMVGAGISPGDVVWVKQADTAQPGDTVVALLAGEEVTVKHLVQEEGAWVLRANNPLKEYPDIPLGPQDRIIGVVQRVVKRPGPPPKKARG